MMKLPDLIKQFSRPISVSDGDMPYKTSVRDLLSLDSSTVLGSTVVELAGFLNAAAWAILVHDDGGLEVAARHPLTSEAKSQRSGTNGTGFLSAELISAVAQSPLIEIRENGTDAKEGQVFARGLLRYLNLDNVRSGLIAPITFNTRLLGALLVCDPAKRRKWSAVERHLLWLTASSLSLALTKIEYYEKAKSAIDRETMISRLLTAIRTAYSVDQMLKVGVEGLGQSLAVTRAVLYMNCDGEAGRLGGDGLGSNIIAREEYRAGDSIPSLIGTRLDIEESPLMGRALAGHIVSVPDTSDSDPIIRAMAVRLGIRSLVLAPISSSGRTVAVLALEQCDNTRIFSDDEFALLRLVVDQTAVALRQSDLHREAQESARREALIGKISSAIHTSPDQETVLQTIVNDLGAALSVCRCRLVLLPDPMPEQLSVTHEYVSPCCYGRPPDLRVIPVIDNLHLQSILSAHRPVASDDVYADPTLTPYIDQLRLAGVKSVLEATIWLGGRPVGLLTLQNCERRHSWTKWEIDIVQSVAEQTAVAIRQAEFYREARESATRAALVNQIVAAIRRSLDLNETLQVTVEELGRALGANRISFRKLVGNQMVVVAEYLSDPNLSIRNAPAVFGELVQSMLKTKRTLIMDDVSAFAMANPQSVAAPSGWRLEPSSLSQILCPIFVNETLWGALSISQADRIREWSTGEIALVEAVTAQVEVAVSHSDLFEEAKQAAKREALISHIIYGINQSNRLDEILAIVARGLGEHLDVDQLLIGRFNTSANHWAIECEYSNERIFTPGTIFKSEDFSGLVELLERGPILCNDLQDDARFGTYLDRFSGPSGTRAFLAVPVKQNSALRLVVAAVMHHRPREWTTEEIEVVRAAANQLMIGLDRAELFEEVSHGKHEWEATFDALNDGVFIFDRHGLLRRVNLAGAAMEGVKVNNIIGRQCCTLLPGIEGETCRVGPVIETGRPITYELVPERLNRSLLVTISPLANGNGTLGAVCIVRDLSELRAAEAAVREQRSFLAKLIEHANDAIFALSNQGRFIWFNEQLCTLSGYSREELTTSDYEQFIPADERKLVVDRFARALAGEAQTFEMRGLTRSREVRLLLITYSPIYDEGKVSSILCIARDVTEERLAAERAAQADKLRALGQLASGVAHNFNNVLAAILGHAQLLKRDLKDSSSMMDRVDIIERAALDGAQTVRRIQGFALQQNESVFETVDVNQLLHDSTNLTRARWADDAQARGLNYEVELKLNAVPSVMGAASELREVFVNLILNALDAMPNGGRLVISSDSRASEVYISFADNGVGMTKQVRERIFEPFFTTKATTGMGLGLAVSYSIVDRHGGRIEARSEAGEGATFTITMPVAGSLRRIAPRPVTTTVPSAKILVIDDDSRVCDALVGILKAAGHKAEHAAGGREGLNKLENHRFNVVLTDLSMPEMDGWAVAAEIRERWPEVRVILATGFAVPPEMMDLRQHLVDAVVLKPIRLDDLTAILGQVLS